MNNTISFMSANYVARQLDYTMTAGWMQGDRATQDYFRPLETFLARFEALLLEIKGLGFSAIDIWLGHLHWSWASADHIAAARGLLHQHGFTVASLAGGFGQTHSEFEAACKLAAALDTRILGGSTPLAQSDRPFVVETLKKFDLLLGLENHPAEKTAADTLTLIGDGGEGRIGTAVDTGWYGTNGYDAAQAIRELRGHLFHVHLKDVRAAGAHETCRYDQGIVPIQECVQALQELGYRGGYSIEHEPEHFNPNDDCVANLAMLREWLGQ